MATMGTPRNLQADCTAALNACGVVVKDLQQETELQKHIIEDQEKRHTDEASEISESRQWYRSPPFLIGLGLVTGLVGGVYLERH
jgi:hypothetical protein